MNKLKYTNILVVEASYYFNCTHCQYCKSKGRGFENFDELGPPQIPLASPIVLVLYTPKSKLVHKLKGHKSE